MSIRKQAYVARRRGSARALEEAALPGSKRHIVIRAVNAFRHMDRQEKLQKALNMPKRYAGGRGAMQKKISQLLNEPLSSSAAFYVNMFIHCSVIASVALNIGMTVDGFDTPTARLFETIFAVTFTFELVLRCLCQYNSCADVLKDMFFFIDVAAIFGFYVQLVTPELAIWKAFRAIRLLKLCRHHDGGSTLVVAVSESLEALKVPLFFCMITSIVFGMLLFHVEETAIKFENLDIAEEDKIQSAVHAIWFMVVTMCTVGYGDMVPRTFTGTLLTVLTIFLGVLFMAMPLAIMGTNFVRVWEERHVYKAAGKLKQILRMKGTDRASMVAAFAEFDYDHSGLLSIDELAFCFSNLGLDLSRRDMIKVWKAIDTDNMGTVCVEEFIDFIFPDSSDYAAIEPSSEPNLGNTILPPKNRKMERKNTVARVFDFAASSSSRSSSSGGGRGASGASLVAVAPIPEDTPLRKPSRKPLRQLSADFELSLQRLPSPVLGSSSSDTSSRCSGSDSGSGSGSPIGLKAIDEDHLLRELIINSTKKRKSALLTEGSFRHTGSGIEMGGALVKRCKVSLGAVRTQQKILRDRMETVPFKIESVPSLHTTRVVAMSVAEAVADRNSEIVLPDGGRVWAHVAQKDYRAAIVLLEQASNAATAALMTAEIFAEVQRNAARMMQRSAELRHLTVTQYKMATDLVATARVNSM